MTKTIRRIFTLCVLVVLCMAMALTASADSALCLAGEYGRLRGQCYQNVDDPYILNASTSITRNNDGAYLVMYLDVWELGGTTALSTFTSEPGDLLLTCDSPLYTAIGFEPERVHVDHQLRDDDGDLLYEVSTSEVFSFP